MEIELRKAKAIDLENVYNLRIEESVMRSSLNKSINYEDYEEEYLEQIKSTNFLYLIAEDDKKEFIGIIKFEEHMGKVNVFIAVCPEYREMGCGEKILKCGIDLLNEEYGDLEEIEAYIYKYNLASLRLFKSYGFSFIYEIRSIMKYNLKISG